MATKIELTIPTHCLVRFQHRRDLFDMQEVDLVLESLDVTELALRFAFETGVVPRNLPRYVEGAALAWQFCPAKGSNPTQLWMKSFGSTVGLLLSLAGCDHELAYVGDAARSLVLASARLDHAAVLLAADVLAHCLTLKDLYPRHRTIVLHAHNLCCVLLPRFAQLEVLSHDVARREVWERCRGRVNTLVDACEDMLVLRADVDDIETWRDIERRLRARDAELSVDDLIQ